MLRKSVVRGTRKAARPASERTIVRAGDDPWRSATPVTIGRSGEARIPPRLAASDVLWLQRTVGNRAVQNLLGSAVRKRADQDPTGVSSADRRGSPVDRTSSPLTGSAVIQRAMTRGNDGLYTHPSMRDVKFVPVTEGGVEYYRTVPGGQYYKYDADSDTLTGPVTAPVATKPPANVEFEDIDAGFVLGSPLAPTPQAPAPPVGFVANVPATPDINLAKVAASYLGGFNSMDSARARLGLVIGLNAWDTAENRVKLQQAVATFKSSWNDNKFLVGVFAFVWRSHKVRSKADIGQDTIPYGQIRDKILRHPFSEHFATLLTSVAQCQRLYMHTGDADVQSLMTAGGTGQPSQPLFEAASTKLGGQDQIDALSGGYDIRVPGRGADEGLEQFKQRRRQNILASCASKLDLAVRSAMARADVNTVYFPEPNTFLLVHTDWGMNTLEGEVSFGEGSKEGRQVISSLAKSREKAGFSKVFDQRLAIPTSGERIAKDVGALGQSVDAATIRSLFHGYTQTHARPQTWQDQVKITLGNLNGSQIAQLQNLVELVYAGIHPDYDPETILKLNDDIDESKLAALSDLPETTRDVGQRTRKAIVRGLKQIIAGLKKI
jgi:hypothetical protein